MALYKGSQKIRPIYLGPKKIQHIYKGSQLVYKGYEQGTQTGHVSIDFWGDETQTITVTFPKEFYTVPTVTIAIDTSYSNKNTGHIASKKVTSITTTGCKIVLVGDGDGSQGIYGKIKWTAKGML